MIADFQVTNELLPGYDQDFTPYLFHHPDHLALQAPTWEHYYLLRKFNQKNLAKISVHIKDGQASTPVKAPFGSILFSSRIAPQNLYEFIQEVEVLLKKKGVKIMTLKEPPAFYREFPDMLHTILFNLGYHVRHAEMSAGIHVNHLDFEDRIERWELRKLRQGKDKGLQARQLPITELETVYDFILKCRMQRDQTLSMKLEDLQRTVSVFKNDFVLFGTFLGKEMAAASIGIKVTEEIFYNFYSAHLKKYDTLSPVVTLMSAVYKYCGTQRFKLLDLGTSSLKGQPNFPLLDFKIRLGGVPSMKLTFEKAL